MDHMDHDNGVINAENLNVDATLDSISKELKAGETLILEVSGDNHYQTDVIFDKLIMRGYEVKKLYRDGKNQIFVSRKL